MITYQEGDILKSNAQAIVNPVNCVGVMGKGLALQVKQAHPANYAEYRQACKDGALRPGTILTHRLPPQSPDAEPRYILNLPTKRHWKDPSQMEDLRSGIAALVRTAAQLNLKSIAVPAIGAGLGGLDWNLVHQELLQQMLPLDWIEVHIYPPQMQSRPNRDLK